MGGFPSGQRGQTVNLLQLASVVRIHLRPFKCRSGGTGRRTGLKILRDLYSRTGSIPVCGIDEMRSVEEHFSFFFALRDEIQIDIMIFGIRLRGDYANEK